MGGVDWGGGEGWGLRGGDGRDLMEGEGCGLGFDDMKGVGIGGSAGVVALMEDTLRRDDGDMSNAFIECTLSMVRNSKCTVE